MQKANQSTAYTKIVVNGALRAKAKQITTYTKTKVDNYFVDKLSQLIVGDLAHPIGAPIGAGFAILAGKSRIRGLVVQSPLTISNMGGSTYWLLGMDTFSISSKVEASAVCTQTEVNNALSAKVDQSTKPTRRQR